MTLFTLYIIITYLIGIGIYINIFNKQLNSYDKIYISIIFLLSFITVPILIGWVLVEDKDL